MSLIEVSGLNKVFRVRQRREGLGGALRSVVSPRYERKVAVRDVSFSIPSGQIVGYIGPTGAGKSTTVKCLAGILAPTAGRVRVKGLDPCRQRSAHTRHIGVVFGQKTSLWWDVPVIDTYHLLRHIYEVPAKDFNESLELITTTLGIAEFQDVPTRQLSLGQRMRADLGAALLHRPDILFLDEPTIGLDVAAKNSLRELILRINRELGVTVLLTTHDLQDVELLCSRVMIIDHGQLIFDGGLGEIIAKHVSWTTIVAELAEPGGAIEIPYTEEVRRADSRVWLRFPRERVSLATVASELMRQVSVSDFRVEEASIDDVVRSIYDGSTDLRPVDVSA